MPAGKHKSRSLRRVYTKVSTRVSLQYKKRKPKKAHCSKCSDVLKGVPRERPYKMQNMPKTKKRPQRPFGGVLCSKCMREKIKSDIRQ
jgi:large subunit ribosomal protein L34e